VADHGGDWTHDDWLRLLADLSRSPYWPLDLDALADVLEEVRQEWYNLRRWEQSAQPGAWVEAREGHWDRDDRPALRQFLQQSGFWPLDLEAAEAVLHRRTAEWWNLRRWQESGQPELWVEARQGRWGHRDWLILLEGLRQSAYWPVDPDSVGAVLEQARQRYRGLREGRTPEHATESLPREQDLETQTGPQSLGLMPRPTGHLGLLWLFDQRYTDAPAA
jgi:hypothetical protein